MSEDISLISAATPTVSTDADQSMPVTADCETAASETGARAQDMIARAEAASQFLKALSHEGRLMILCHLASTEKSVTELEHLLGQRQAAVSQQLARLRSEGLVNTRRDGKAIYYSICDARVTQIVALLHDMFCTEDTEAR